MKKQRKLIIGFMLLLALVVSGFTYAYWAGGITANLSVNKPNNIQIGQGQQVTTTVSVTDGTTTANQILVPNGRIGETAPEGKTLVSAVTYTFNLTWDNASSASDAAGATAPLTVTPTLAISTALSNERLNALFTITHSIPATVTYNNPATITITVTFTNEPLNSVEYALVANAVLTLNVLFELGAVIPAP